MGENLCDTGRIPTIQEYCDFRKNGIAYASDVKPQVTSQNEVLLGSERSTFGLVVL